MILKIRYFYLNFNYQNVSKVFINNHLLYISNSEFASITPFLRFTIIIHMVTGNQPLFQIHVDKCVPGHGSPKSLRL